MPEDIEIETKDLQETIEELQDERKERAEEEKKVAWTRYIALTTALLAVFAAIGALQSGALVNEAMMLQLQASDHWNQYQAARQKDHMYTMQAESLLDHGARMPAGADRAEPKAPSGAPHRVAKPKRWQALAPDARLLLYRRQVDGEVEKEKELSVEAKKLEKESEHNMHLHHLFAQAVTLIQVAVALSAVAALSRIKWVWVFGTVLGVAGIGLFAAGFLSK